ncbi:multicopper oxidase family protein [Microbacterium sp. NPDC055357]
MSTASPTPPVSPAPSPHRRRRRLLAVLVAVPLVAVVATGCLWAVTEVGRTAPPAAGTTTFDTELAIPPLDEGRMEDGVRVFDLVAQEASSDIVSQGTTRTLGYNGAHLGPTLAAQRGESVRVDVTNELGDPTTVHWHGMHVPAAMDGGPHNAIASGGSWRAEWTVDQPAATLWYHPHLHGRTREQVDAGLAGLFLLRDDEEAGLDLPRTYGIDDVPLIVQDRRFHSDGSFDGRVGTTFDGALGDTILVNGTASTYLEVTTQRVRLRIVNGSSARMYHFAFADDRVFQLIGTDGGLLDAPVDATGIPLSPGERAEIVVHVTAGERIVLGSTSPDPQLHAGADSFDVLELRAAASLAPSPDVPDRLATLPAVAAEDIAAERTFELSGHNINDRQMDMGRVDHVSVVDTNELWTVRNINPLPHSFHVHDTQFRIVDVDGAPPPARLAGWKDTIALEWRREYRLLVRFSDHADPTTPYMYHCHLLWHEDQGMMGQFLVVEPGQTPALKRPEGDSDDHHDH